MRKFTTGKTESNASGIAKSKY